MIDANAESEFANHEVPGESVPDYREVRFEALAGSFRRYVLISTACLWSPVPLAALAVWLVPFLSLEPRVVAAIAVLTGAAVFAGVYRWIDAGYRGWALRQHDIVARAGILWRSITALPIARIQHVETSHGPLERWHRIARLKLYTAGGLTADLIVIGLARETADRLREYLVEQIRLRDELSRRPTDG